MSVEQLTEQMKSQLLAGARRRVRHERRRRLVASGIAALSVLVGVIVAVVVSRDPETVTTIATTTTIPSSVSTSLSVTTTVEEVAPTSLGPPIVTAPVKPGGPAEFAVCDQYLSFIWSISPTTIDKSMWVALASSAAATGDTDLARIAAAARDTWTDTFTPENAAAKKQFADHCTAIGSTNFNPRYEPIELGPQPTVDLARFGQEQAFMFTGGPPPVTNQPRGRNLSAVQVVISAQGGFVMYWSYLGQGDRTEYCRSYGSALVVQLTGCGSDDPRYGVSAQPFATTQALTTLQASIATSFVVMEAGGERYVQRPAVGIAVIVWATTPAERSVTAREYDVNGRELRCHGAC